jgi:hypothetical protein
MPHEPDYESPWGSPQSEEEMSQIHKRWAAGMRKEHGRMTPPAEIEGEDWSLAQCGGCSYFIPLEGSIGMDWGACSCADSSHDREVVFEHFGCVRHSESGRMVDRK